MNETVVGDHLIFNDRQSVYFFSCSVEGGGNVIIREIIDFLLLRLLMEFRCRWSRPNFLSRPCTYSIQCNTAPSLPFLILLLQLPFAYLFTILCIFCSKLEITSIDIECVLYFCSCFDCVGDRHPQYYIHYWQCQN